MAPDDGIGLKSPKPTQLIRVIFVEDDEFFRSAVEVELSKEGFVVHPFNDGGPMLTAIADGLVADIVVLNWECKSILGIDLLTLLKDRGVQWPILFLTGRSNPVLETIALRRGAADFIDKARGIPVLAARLRLALVQRRDLSPSTSDDSLRCGRATLSISSSRGYWDGNDVGLTVMEFKIVQLLVSNAGSFVTYRQIYDCIHRVGFVAGNGEHGYRTNVRSAVRRIREKFSAYSNDFDLIQTYPSYGYCWRKSA